MNEEQSSEDIVRISSIPLITETLSKHVHHPNELDEATKSLDIPAALLNPYLATPLDLSMLGLGQVVHIPVQISKREGGRKSVFYLEEGEKTLAGIYVTRQGIALSFIQRVTGSTLPAKTGDTYLMWLTNREGKEVFKGTLNLDVTDASAGEATFYVKDSPADIVWGTHCIIYSALVTIKKG